MQTVCSYNNCGNEATQEFVVRKTDPNGVERSSLPIYSTGVSRRYCVLHEKEIRAAGYKLSQS